jgi:acetoacetyl-CoA synthetase
VPFDHPLWVLYSSGTTGLPKAIVHGHGGIVLEHLKALSLHCDLGPGDRFFWYSTTGWMMWNFLVSGLLVGSTVVLYDGSPGFPDLEALWRMAEREKLTYFGTSAPFLLACQKAGVEPQRHGLEALRSVGSTGAPLPASGFAWVYEHVRSDLLLGSISGGTDVCTAFALSCPLLPVRAGALQCAGLGCKVEAFDPEGRPLRGEVGELVLTAPLPSMPLFFWGDPEGVRYRESYFETFPGVWRHGDWVRIDDEGWLVISGRSDSTLNRGGVRMGTSEFYAVVERLEAVADSLVVDTSSPSEPEGKLWLFVVARDALWDGERERALRAAIRSEISPRHVPDEIVAVRAIPRTLSGKKCEIPVKRILSGVPVEKAISRDTLTDPRSIDEYVALRARLAGS